jgi:hypothetical protein
VAKDNAQSVASWLASNATSIYPHAIYVVKTFAITASPSAISANSRALIVAFVPRISVRIQRSRRAPCAMNPSAEAVE